LTIIENKTETDTKNIILECSAKITFNQVSENIKKTINVLNKSYFKREYMFLSIDAFYKFNGKLTKESHTEQYFIIFFKNNKEFSELINNPHINIEELNKKDIYFIFVIPNTFKDIHKEDTYYLYNHLYLDLKKPIKINKTNEDLSMEEMLSTSGFQTLSEFSQLDIIENIPLDKDSVARLRFHSIISESMGEYYMKNIYKNTYSLSKLKNKILTMF